MEVWGISVSQCSFCRSIYRLMCFFKQGLAGRLCSGRKWRIQRRKWRESTAEEAWWQWTCRPCEETKTWAEWETARCWALTQTAESPARTPPASLIYSLNKNCCEKKNRNKRGLKKHFGFYMQLYSLQKNTAAECERCEKKNQPRRWLRKHFGFYMEQMWTVWTYSWIKWPVEDAHSKYSYETFIMNVFNVRIH